MPSDRVLIALLIAAASGYAMLRHARRMMFHGISIGDGGGWAVIVMLEFTTAVGALAIALS